MITDIIALCAECGGPLKWTGISGTTLVGVQWSPPGHNHNDNCLYRVYACEKGHRHSFFIRRSCPTCDWRGRADCFCHPESKVDTWPA